MKAINLSKHAFSSLQEFNIGKDILNTECKLYFYRDGLSTKLLKIFYIKQGNYFGNKLLTINSLMDSKKEIDIEEVVYPEKLVVVGN